MLLKDKVCLIAGAASPRSIGYATAELFAEHGAKVVLLDLFMTEQVARDFQTTLETRLQRPVSVQGLRCDISRADDCEQAVRQVVERHGTLDCLVNSAGIVQSQPLLDISAADLDRMLDINLKGAFYLCQSALRVFRERRSGTIVNVASLAAQRGGGGGGGTGISGLTSSSMTASTGPLIFLTKARANPELMAHSSATCNTTTSPRPTRCLVGFRCRLA
jgi:NAD(P)-dependent dehydrogenase (short-subunit alcohol dehydrogenase family)